MKIFTAIGQGKKHRYLFVVLATTQSEAQMWVQKWMGLGTILWIGSGAPDYDEVSSRYGHRDIEETWVFDQNLTGKFYQLN